MGVRHFCDRCDGERHPTDLVSYSFLEKVGNAGDSTMWSMDDLCQECRVKLYQLVKGFLDAL